MNITYTTGYAGTGKSTALLKLINSLDPTKSVVLCPTHKALKRLRNHAREEMELKTIHALLGWIPGINESAEHVSHIETTIKLGRDISEYNTIVIDEGGMVSEEMFMEITSKLEEANDYETDHITIHVFLDPYQLLPVKGRQIAIDPSTTTRLTTQHRAESPDIARLFTKFVNVLEGTNKTDLKIEYGENVEKLITIKEFNPETDRLLAYTNECVGNYNREIAKLLGIRGYEGQLVQLGNMSEAIRVDRFVKPTLSDLLEAYAEGRLFLQNSQINLTYLESSLKALIDYKAIEFIEAGDKVIPVIVGINKAHIAKKLIKEACIKDKSNFKWLYAMGRAFIMDYTFASTVHKAQGSEFNRVFIVLEDIQKAIMNGYYDNYARLMYVALSRAKKKVFIL